MSASTLETVWDEIEDIVGDLIPEGRDAPRYQRLESQADKLGSAMHRKFWFRLDPSTIVADRGTEISEVEYSFALLVHFEYTKYQKRTFERAILNESKRIWRAIESNDQWGEGVRSVIVSSIVPDRQDNNDLVMEVSLTAMVDEDGGLRLINYETPTGAIDGSNAAFVLSMVPRITTLVVFLNGLAMKKDVDFTISGRTITFLAPQVPQTGDVLYVKFQGTD